MEIPASDLLPSGSDDEKVDEMENMVSELTEISDSVHFTPSDLESDSGGEFEIGLLLISEVLVALLREEFKHNFTFLLSLQILWILWKSWLSSSKNMVTNWTKRSVKSN